MATQYDVDFNEITHVIINTGYVPPLKNLLGIESVLRDEFESDITCLFASDSTWHLSVMIPNPFGFKPTQLCLPPGGVIDPEFYIEQVDKLMSRCKQHPFYDHAMQSLIGHRKMFDEIYQSQPDHPRLDLYEDLYQMVYEWSIEPWTPDLAFDYNAYKKIEEEHVNLREDDYPTRVYDTFGEHKLIMKEGYHPLISYNDRMAETRKIIDLLGGPMCVDGLCFKLPDEHSVDMLKILPTIIENGLSYCASFNLDGFKYVTNGHMKILVLKYDAEHG